LYLIEPISLNKMNIKVCTIFLTLFLLQKTLHAQVCNQLGQTPASAFPVCGTTSFSQTTVPICLNGIVPVPCPATNVTFYDRNPYWYKFTCFTSGTLGFFITPLTLSDDYDWQLFDVTGKNPNDVFTDATMFVACNWSGEGGITGASNAGTSLVVCEGLGRPLFSSMPLLQAGKNYLLLVSHFTISQSGYQLQFSGGTASITDPTLPILQSARVNCDGTEVTIRLNKKMKCSSLVLNGSDFQLSTGIAAITNASGLGCSNSFDMDSVLITLNNPLPPGTYSIAASMGDDGNTLLDNCNRSVPVQASVSFTVDALLPTPMDSLVKVNCKPASLQLVFKNPIRCSSIAPNGSDFMLNGTQPFSIVSASGSCTNGVTSIITLNLNGTIFTAGSFQLQLVRGTDGNTIISDCGVETPAGATLSFNTKDSVSAKFSFNTLLGCKYDVINFFHGGGNGVNSWNWNFGNSISTSQNPSGILFPANGQYPVQLIVGNGFCKDSIRTVITLNNEVKANFNVSSEICPQDKVEIINISTGSIDSWQWNFGNGNTSTQKNPLPYQYVNTAMDTYYSISLIAVNTNLGCSDTVTKTVKAISNCTILVPTGFTPNGDGLNDFLYPLNTIKAEALDFKIFNRWGQLIFHTNIGSKKWDGSINGKPQDPGVYVWMLSYTHKDTGKKFFLKGHTTLIR